MIRRLMPLTLSSLQQLARRYLPHSKDTDSLDKLRTYLSFLKSKESIPYSHFCKVFLIIYLLSRDTKTGWIKGSLEKQFFFNSHVDSSAICLACHLWKHKIIRSFWKLECITYFSHYVDSYFSKASVQHCAVGQQWFLPTQLIL